MVGTALKKLKRIINDQKAATEQKRKNKKYY